MVPHVEIESRVLRARHVRNGFCRFPTSSLPPSYPRGPLTPLPLFLAHHSQGRRGHGMAGGAPLQSVSRSVGRVGHSSQPCSAQSGSAHAARPILLSPFTSCRRRRQIRARRRCYHIAQKRMTNANGGGSAGNLSSLNLTSVGPSHSRRQLVYRIRARSLIEFLLFSITHVKHMILRREVDGSQRQFAKMQKCCRRRAPRCVTFARARSRSRMQATEGEEVETGERGQRKASMAREKDSFIA